MSGCKACSHTYMLARLHSGACTRMRALMRNTGCGCRNSYGAGAVSWGSPVCHSRRVAACPLRPSRVRVRKSVLSVDDVAVPGCAVAGGRWGAFCPTACPGSGDWSPVCELSRCASVDGLRSDPRRDCGHVSGRGPHRLGPRASRARRLSKISNYVITIRDAVLDTFKASRG